MHSICIHVAQVLIDHNVADYGTLTTKQPFPFRGFYLFHNPFAPGCAHRRLRLQQRRRMAPSSSPSSRRQWLIRLAGAFIFLAVAAAIIAGVLVSKAKEEREARDTRNPTRPNTYNVMNDKSLPPVQAKAIPSIDADYPYQNRPKDTVVNTTAKPAQGTIGGVHLPGIAVPTGAAGGASDKALTVDNLGPNSTFFGRIYARGWNEVAQAQGVGICYPANAAEVVEMVMSPACTIVVLTRSYRNPYVITQTMNITTRKIVVGSPLQPPRFMAKKGLHRYFDGEYHTRGHTKIPSSTMRHSPRVTIPPLCARLQCKMVVTWTCAPSS
jgi:hypothetical protein